MYMEEAGLRRRAIACEQPLNEPRLAIGTGEAPAPPMLLPRGRGHSVMDALTSSSPSVSSSVRIKKVDKVLA